MPDFTNVTTGKNCKIRVNGTTINGVSGHDVDEKVDELDASDAESGGFDEPDAGFHSVTLTIRGVHKLAYGPWPTLIPGNFVANVLAYLNSDNALAVWSLPLALVAACQTNSKTKGQIEYTIRLRSRGIYTRPSA